MPRYAVISDIHANLNALEAVITELNKYKPDKWINLGDVVGYGPSSAECIDVLMDLDFESVLGNHDAGVIGKVKLNHFRNPNRRLIELTQSILQERHLNWLRNLPLTLELSDKILCTHASPVKPDSWIYLDSAFTVRNILSNLDYDICLFGHTHLPSMISEKLGVREFKKGIKYMINPGSVGQSRDQDYRASCCILDTDQWKCDFYRVDYEIDPVSSKLQKMGFSKTEVNRLLRIR
ncbi:MAG: metallophosphoesterase family protein [Balneolaceae bacterium]|nr:metallophosphoesterase family protein [Balneolaceae bacterium]